MCYRLITNLTRLNRCTHTPNYKAESWQTVKSTLANTSLQWATTLDISNYFHHLEMNHQASRWMRIQTPLGPFQLQAMPFGWGPSPWWAHKLSQPIRAAMNDHGIHHCWWVDDLLILGQTPEETATHTLWTITLLTALGLKINKEKSITTPSQQVTYLGHQIDLQSNQLKHLSTKTQPALKLTTKAHKSNSCQPRNLAQVAGTLLDLSHSNSLLRGIPQQLMAMAGKAVTQNSRRCNLPPSHPRCWNLSLPKPSGLKALLQRAMAALRQPEPITFRHQHGHKHWRLTTDASDSGWGAVLETKEAASPQWTQVMTMQNVWSRQEVAQHITKREAIATAKAAQIILPKLHGGDHLLIRTDASSTHWCWTKGSKNQEMNQAITPMWQALQRQSVHTTAEHIRGQHNHLADHLSRHHDPKNYRLNPSVFRAMCHRFKFQPQVDLFASHKNKQLPRYCSWHHDGHRLNQGNAWDIPWTKPSWINPPWELITQVLRKIQTDHTTALVCLPYWKSASWWRTLLELQVTPPIILANQPLYQDPEGTPMPTPRWATLCCIVQG